MGGRTITYHADGSITVEDTRSLADARAEAVERAKRAYEAKIAEGMTWQGKSLQIDETAVARITAVMLQVVAQVPLPPGFAWRMGDNTFLPMDAAGVAAMASAAAAHVQALRVAMWAAVDAARAAETIEAADAVAAPPPPTPPAPQEPEEDPETSSEPES